MPLAYQIINKDKFYYFTDGYFEYKGKRYDIVGVRLTGRGWKNAELTLKCEGKLLEPDSKMEKIVDKLLKEQK